MKKYTWHPTREKVVGVVNGIEQHEVEICGLNECMMHSVYAVNDDGTEEWLFDTTPDQYGAESAVYRLNSQDLVAGDVVGMVKRALIEASAFDSFVRAVFLNSEYRDFDSVLAYAEQVLTDTEIGMR